MYPFLIFLFLFYKFFCLFYFVIPLSLSLLFHTNAFWASLALLGIFFGRGLLFLGLLGNLPLLCSLLLSICSFTLILNAFSISVAFFLGLIWGDGWQPSWLVPPNGSSSAWLGLAGPHTSAAWPRHSWHRLGRSHLACFKPRFLSAQRWPHPSKVRLIEWDYNM